MFQTPEQRDRLVAGLAGAVERHGWLCHAYVVMHNPFHLLVETPLPNLSIGMRRLNGLYAQWFNRGNNRCGHVFGDAASPLRQPAGWNTANLGRPRHHG